MMCALGHTLYPAAGCNIKYFIAVNVFIHIFNGMAGGADGPIPAEVKKKKLYQETATDFALVLHQMSPHFSATLFGLFNGANNLSAVYGPYLAGVILDNGSDVLTQWNLLFYLAAGCYVLSALSFILFVRAEPEEWDQAAASSAASDCEQLDRSDDAIKLPEL